MPAEQGLFALFGTRKAVDLERAARGHFRYNTVHSLVEKDGSTLSRYFASHYTSVEVALLAIVLYCCSILRNIEIRQRVCVFLCLITLLASFRTLTQLALQYPCPSGERPRARTDRVVSPRPVLLSPLLCGQAMQNPKSQNPDPREEKKAGG